MRVEIFDVGHGQCALVTAPNGRRMMVDCGSRWDDASFWLPSLYFFGETIDILALTNLDEDHISDFKGMTGDCHVSRVLTNPTIGVREFRLLKHAGMGPAGEAFATWLAGSRAAPSFTCPDFGAVQIRWYSWSYVPGAINKTNDLSLVVVVQFGRFKIVFSGDLEVAGWRRLLTLPEFRADLAGTTVFVASHHGRESGCCTELFELMCPQFVIISDHEHQYDTQDTNAWYRSRCTGAVFAHNALERRYVATTRKDGSLKLEVNAADRWTIERVKVRDWARKPVAPVREQRFGALASMFGSGLNPAFGENLLSSMGALSQPNSALAVLRDDPLARAFGSNPFAPHLGRL